MAAEDNGDVKTIAQTLEERAAADALNNMWEDV